MKKKIKFFTITGPTTWCSFNPESQNSSSRYRVLHNQAQALM
jgi:chaperonin cofactor prefoldin